jgi:hypothetical protein
MASTSTSDADAAAAVIAATAPPEWDLLLSAAQKNQSDKIRDMIVKENVNASHANAVGQSALHIAALWGHGTCIRVWKCVEVCKYGSVGQTSATSS